ncbi:MAG TPA: hypothetical protein VH144_00720 [Candidatus Saccharimonadales bacterium]|jgi:hypothetical protein|nr:hypothetical protein [Candidatus Saccharimonadales bacterium]
MALFIRQDEQRSQLRAKVTADLQDRMKKTSSIEPTDVSKDATILQNQHQTKGRGIIIAIIVVIIIIAALWLLKPSGN